MIKYAQQSLCDIRLQAEHAMQLLHLNCKQQQQRVSTADAAP
jgi:hypothetical protein